MAKTDHHENAVLNTARGTALAAWTPYVAIFVAVTDAEAGTITEVSGGGYARVAATFGAPTAGAMANSAEVALATAASDLGTGTHFGLFDDPTAGNLRYVTALGSSFAYNTGVTPRFAIGALDVTED